MEVKVVARVTDIMDVTDIIHVTDIVDVTDIMDVVDVTLGSVHYLREGGLENFNSAAESYIPPPSSQNQNC